MTKRQIYDRLNRCYHNQFVEKESDIETDAWYGNPNDDFTTWHFRRPSAKVEYQLHLETDTGLITSMIKEDGGEWTPYSVFTLKDYFYKFDGEDEFNKSSDYPFN